METVGAEEIELRVPGGNSVATRINTTSIHMKQEKEVASYVVTIGDLAALEEIERLRWAFSATVSYELRVPLGSRQVAAVGEAGAAGGHVAVAGAVGVVGYPEGEQLP